MHNEQPRYREGYKLAKVFFIGRTNGGVAKKINATRSYG